MIASDTDLRVYRGVPVSLADEDEAPCRRLWKNPVPRCRHGVYVQNTLIGRVRLIALFANDVTRYHEYALGSHPGASRTNYSGKWPLAIGMRCRC